MSQNYEEEVTPLEGTSEEATEKATNSQIGLSKTKETDFVVIQRLLAQNVAEQSFRTEDAKKVRDCMMNIIKTTGALSALEEFQDKLVVGGQACRISEYRAPATWTNLLAPARIVVADVVSAFDFTNRKMYGSAVGKVLDPEDFMKAWKTISKALRVNPSYLNFERKETMLLSEATKYAVNSRRVVDVNQDRILFLTQKFDDEAVVRWDRWAAAFSDRMFQ